MKKLFALMALVASVFAVSCNKGNDDNGKDDGGKGNETTGLIPVKIDGAFEDWATLKPEVVASAKNNPNSPWDAVSEIRCCADKEFVYYYIKYNKEVLDEQMENKEGLHIRLNFNNDGVDTNGYQKYFLEGTDVMIEGSLGDEQGHWADFSGTVFQYLTDGWDEGTPAIVSGKGNGAEYEIAVPRQTFNNQVAAEVKIGDVFYTSIRFYGNGGWNELSNMPNASTEDSEEGNGWGHMLKVTTVQTY